ncbi:S-adenosyl-L-methionine-dependent methyltransferase [Apiospora kogelbergensis]|uniref:S-adenosyl-L-methionine-dependent methyltransferase n=1 Tax=Apiospora kogelbergensis TaxID=1337665 RepID=A0AAW0R124_9PEZI
MAAEPREVIFRKYSTEDGKNYASFRPTYHENLYKLVLDHHASTGGQFDTIVDLGCGPGTTVRELAPKFQHAFGFDPSEGMTSAARSLGGASSTGEPIRFEVSSAEEIGSELAPGDIPNGSVDLIVASTAAHWFDLARFWPRAAEVLKPGGTVAFWGSSGSTYAHPSMPNHEAITAVLQHYEEHYFKPYYQPGNFTSSDLYKNLAYPWDLDPPLAEFDQGTFFRKEWDPKAWESDYIIQPPTDLDRMEKAMATVSPVQRWREAHPDLAGTEKDMIRMMRRDIEKILHQAGVEKGKEQLKAGIAAVLVIVKKKL